MVTEKNINVTNFVQMFQLTDTEMWSWGLVFRERRTDRASNTFIKHIKLLK